MTRWIPLLLALGAAPVYAQGFTSGSDGTDGALNVTTSGDFDPAALGLDADGDGVYHFTTINVAAGVTLRLRASILGEGKPVVWLATGEVTIAGTLNLDGSQGHLASAPPLPSEAGAGGFAGGAGRTAVTRARSGSGPGGGLISVGANGGGAGHAVPGASSSAPNGGPAYGNVFLLPLTGGSGGAGYDYAIGSAGGGAGGGAILIASDTRITVSGAINARGGAAGRVNSNSDSFAGSGSGGGVRLIAPTCTGSGTIDVNGSTGGIDSSAGRIRIEAFSQQLTGVSPTNVATFARPGAVLLPANAPKLVASLVLTDGTIVPIPADPKGGFSLADAVVNTNDPVTLTIATTNIPLGTLVQVRIVPEDGVAIVLTSAPITGTKAVGTAVTGPFNLQTGFTRFALSANFN